MQYDNKWGFEVNHSGGWIVPAGTCFDEAVVFPRYSEFGSYSKFGSNSEIEGVIFTKMMQLQNLDGSLVGKSTLLSTQKVSLFVLVVSLVHQSSFAVKHCLKVRKLTLL